jgi:hypothetical protein
MDEPKAEGQDPIRAVWINEIELYERDSEKWYTRAKKIVKKYKDAEDSKSKKSRYNVLWANTQTLAPALYARDPKPEAERRFKDADAIGRLAATVLERCLTYTVDLCGFSWAMRQSVQDRLLSGRGTVWVRYAPEIIEEQITYEKAHIDYVYWEDFGHTLDRTWDELRGVWRKSYLGRAELVKRFGDVGEKIPLDYSPKDIKDRTLEDGNKKAAIYEIWDKTHERVIFLSKSYPKVIEIKERAGEDFVDFDGFFPCPRPLFATQTTDSLIPTPDYLIYQDQAIQLEDLTQRIASISRSLKVAGVYDAAAEGVERLLNEGVENKLIPVESWALLKEKGGLKGAMEFLPLLEIVQALSELQQAREIVKQDLYELTGIADIIRGNSDPRETAKAQQLKGQFAVLRLSDSQAEVQRFARDTMRLLTEIIAENFQLESIQSMSGIELLTQAQKQQIQQQQAFAAQQAQAAAQQAPQQPPPQPPPLDEKVQRLLEQPTWEEVYALLNSNALRNFRIDIETDSTIRTDEDREKEQRMEFLNAAGGFLEKAALLPAQLQPIGAELLMFGARSFKAGRSLETAFEDLQKQIEQAKKAPPTPDPEMMKIQAESQARMAELQAKTQADIQIAQGQQQMQAQDSQLTAQVELQKHEMEMRHQAALEQVKSGFSQQIEALKAQSAERIAQLNNESAERIAMLNARIKLESEQMKAENDRQKTAINSQRANTEAVSTAVSAENENRKIDQDGERIELEKSGNDTESKADEKGEMLAAMKSLTEAMANLRKPRKVVRDLEGRIAELH